LFNNASTFSNRKNLENCNFLNLIPILIPVIAQVGEKMAVQGHEPGRVFRFGKFSGNFDPVFVRDVVVLAVAERDLPKIL
jgi:hypothetical protein